MNREKIEQIVNKIFIDTFELDPKDLYPEKELFNDLGLDSLDMVDLMVEVYKKTGINMRNDDEVMKIRTLGDVYNYIEKWIKAHPDQVAKIEE